MIEPTENAKDVRAGDALQVLPLSDQLDGEGLRGDESNNILQAMDAAIKVSNASAEIRAHAAEHYNRVSLGRSEHEPVLLKRRKQKKKERKQAKRIAHHSEKRVSFFHYSHYDIAFKYLIEQVFEAEWVKVPPRTKHSSDIGARYSSDYVCTPFKHILGDYIDALEAGANVLVTFPGPCRLGYYGELHESILRDLSYEFETLNFSTLRGVKGYIEGVHKINPKLDVPHVVPRLISVVKLIENLDEAYDFYMANAGFEVEKGSFQAAWRDYRETMMHVSSDAEITAAHTAGMKAFRSIPIDKPANPIRVGIVGELFTAIDQHSNLNTEDKLLAMGVELHRGITLTSRYLKYSEPNLRAGVGDYVTYDMGITSTLTISSAKRYAEEGFDGIVHIKSSGCTPEIDCVPVLQEIARDYHVSTLFLTFDSQTSDAGLDTRLEAFYDMLAMKKGKDIS